MAESHGAVYLDLGTIGIVYVDEIEERFVQAGGPGGQHVNKVATAVQLRFALQAARGLSARIKQRLPEIAPHLVTASGDVRLEARRFRAQDRNRSDARDRLAALIEEAALPPPPPRRGTRPTKASIKRRLDAKSARKSVKAGRGRMRDAAID